MIIILNGYILVPRGSIVERIACRFPSKMLRVENARIGSDCTSYSRISFG